MGEIFTRRTLTGLRNEFSETRVVETVTPLAANASFTSAPFICADWGVIAGTVFADQAGTLYVQFSDDQENWDGEESITYAANTRTGFLVDVTMPYCRIIYTNGATAQTTFRLFVRMRRF